MGERSRGQCLAATGERSCYIERGSRITDGSPDRSAKGEATGMTWECGEKADQDQSREGIKRSGGESRESRERGRQSREQPNLVRGKEIELRSD